MKFKCPKCSGDVYLIISRVIGDVEEGFTVYCDNIKSLDESCDWEQIVSDEEVAIFAAQRYVIAQAEKKRAKKRNNI